MPRLFGLFLSPLFLVLPACESEPTLEDDVDAVVAATADVAVFLCECSFEADGKDPEACSEAADEVLGDDVDACIEDVVAMDPSSRGVMQCSTGALRDLLDCYERAGLCPEARASSDSTTSNGEEPVTEDDEPISDDACGLALEEDIKACGELSAATQEALDGCFLGDDAESDRCVGDDCD